MTRILIFVDESGTPNQVETLFSVAAVWCSPQTREGAQTTLRYTVDQLREFVRDRTGAHPPELKHSASTRIACGMVERLLSVSAQDFSIDRKEQPWDGAPLAFTLSSLSCRAEWVLQSSMPGATTRSDFGDCMRARSLVSILRPLISYDGTDRLEASVILDDFVWGRAAYKLGRQLELVSDPRRVRGSIHCEKSSKTPGLQIADLVAGVNWRFVLWAEDEPAYRAILQRNLYHLNRARS